MLLTHPEIVDAAVIGISAPNQSDGEVPRAYLVARPGTSPTADSIKDHMAERLAKYKHCNGGIVFVDAIPKTASGKILKRTLLEQAKKELEEAGEKQVKAKM